MDSSDIEDPFFQFPTSDAIFQFQSDIKVHAGDCREIVARMVQDGFTCDAIITDPPYEISYMDKGWDASGVAFDPATWKILLSALKPGGFVLAFSSARTYHHLALAIEGQGIETYPMLHWTYPTGLPKPVNVSKLFDRENCPDRMPIGMKRGSGYNTAHVKHGRQNYTKMDFPVYEENISDEAKRWSGYFYGVNTLKPAFDPIYIGRKPIATERTIDNLRRHGTGALNVGALKERKGEYPSNVFRCAKTRPTDHQSDHPTVKPIPLMEELILLACPGGGRVLDPFGGTGTTGMACLNLGFSVDLIELDPQMAEFANKRFCL